jgi:hypothetical protein
VNEKTHTALEHYAKVFLCFLSTSATLYGNRPALVLVLLPFDYDISSLFVWLVADGWCWICSGRKVLLAG